MRIELEITRTSVKVEFDSDSPQKPYPTQPHDVELPLLPDPNAMIITAFLTLAAQAAERLEPER